MSGTNPTKEFCGSPEVALIVAMTSDYLIGSREGLPWDLPEDLKLFKRLTMGATVIMGRTTYATIGHPLQGRHNIVLSRRSLDLPGVMICNSLETALTVVSQSGRKAFIIGGEEVYREALPIVSELHISWVKGSFAGDCFFPTFDLRDWKICGEEHYTDFQYNCYRRVSCG